MDYTVVRTSSEIDAVRNFAWEGRDGGTHYRGMSYEDGIEETLAWLFGETDDNPAVG